MKAHLLLSIFFSLALSACYNQQTQQQPVDIHVSINQQQVHPQVYFSASFHHPTPKILTWHFGDGFNGQGNNVQHNYLSPGEYTAKLEYEYQGAWVQHDIAVSIPGSYQTLRIQAPSPFMMDSDHNDPNQVFSSNNIHPQAISSPVTLSGILMKKNACQAGNLCQQGDEIDQYQVIIKDGEEIQIEILKGAINFQLLNIDGSTIFNSTQQINSFTVESRILSEGQYTLQFHLADQEMQAQYLLRIHKYTEQMLNYQPGKLIVMWHGQSKPELLDIHDPRLASLNSNDIQQGRQLLFSQKNVKSVSYNYIRKAFSNTNNNEYNTWQWPLEFQQISDLWEPLAMRGFTPADNISIAILDTGLFLQHPNLKNIKTHSGFDFVSDPVNANDGDSWDNNPTDPGDAQLSYHGTHVAGIIAAQAGSPPLSSQWIKGLAWGAQIMPIRVLGINGGTSYDLIQALRYAAGLENDSGTLPEKPADIINLSLGGDQFSAAEQATINAVTNSGVIIVAATGNEGDKQVNYPAGYDQVIAVGALTKNNETASYSNYGHYLDLLAPGGICHEPTCIDGIRSLGASGQIVQGQDQRAPTWRNLAGTSMASAHVSALLALARSHLPALDSLQLKRLLSQQMLNQDMLEPGFDEFSGWGQLNSHKIMQLIDSSPLNTDKLWADKYTLFLEVNESQTLQLTQRGSDSYVDSILEYPSEFLEVERQDNKISIKLLKAIIEHKTIQLKYNQHTLLSLNVYPVSQVKNKQYQEHLYLNLVDSKDSKPLGRASLEANSWLGYIESEHTKNRLQASSDIDYDGVYCEPGEFCAIDQGSNSKKGAITLQGQLLNH